MNKMTALLIYRNQEILRYNNLINLIQNSMNDLQNAIKGQIVMSLELESVYNSFLENKIPTLWRNISYLSIKPLGQWLVDFGKRLEFFKNWSIR